MEPAQVSILAFNAVVPQTDTDVVEHFRSSTHKKKPHDGLSDVYHSGRVKALKADL